MQKYVIVKLLEPMTIGTEFSSSNWPLHITIVSNFAINWDRFTIAERLKTLLQNHAPFKAVAGEDEIFGGKRQISVTLIEKNNDIQSLHDDLCILLSQANAVFDTPQYLRKGYRAHATIQQNARLNKGDTVVIDEVALVDMYPGGDIHQRKLLATIPLSGLKP